MKLKYVVNNKNYTTIKQVLKEEFHISDRLLIKLKLKQAIFLNNQATSVNTQIALGRR